MHSIRPLVPLLMAAGVLLAGNGLQSTLIALRGAREGFSPAMIGFIGAAYFAGFLLGCMVITQMLRSVGHVRVFSALAAVAAAVSLLQLLFIDPMVWAGLRLVTGFCFAGLFTTIESWLNSGVSNNTRGRMLAVYRIVDISAVTGSQFAIPLIGIDGFAIFVVMGIVIMISIVPITLGDRSNPKPPAELRLDLAGVWRVSPLASFICVGVGITNGSFRMVGPVYAEELGLSATGIAWFMSAGIIGGAVMQYPLGYLSDRWDRRRVMLGSVTGALGASLALFIYGTPQLSSLLVLVLLFGAFAMPLYSLAAAHANDHAGNGEYVKVAAALMFFYSIGAVVGPLAASSLMEAFGPRFLFGFSALVYAGMVALTIYRMIERAPVPPESRGRFTSLLRTSPVFARLVPDAERKRGREER